MSDTIVKSFPTVITGEGVTRKVVADSPELMVVEFHFDTGGVGALHNHPHVQSTYVQSGTFEFTVGDEKTVVRTGDSFVIPSNVVHGCRALEGGTLVDCFTPRRDDFL